MASTTLLEARDISVVRGKRKLLDGVWLALEPGQTMALVGPNGAGKSTLLKALAGIVVHQGELFLDRRPATSLSPQERARLLAYVP